VRRAIALDHHSSAITDTGLVVGLAPSAVVMAAQGSGGSQHGRLEKYDKRGRHQGEFNPDTGKQTKPADPSRMIEP